MSGAAARSLRVARVRGVYNSPTVDFNAAMRLQELLRDCRHSAGVAADPADHLLLLQHSPVSLSAARKLPHAQFSTLSILRGDILRRCIHLVGAQLQRRGG